MTEDEAINAISNSIMVEEYKRILDILQAAAKNGEGPRDRHGQKGSPMSVHRIEDQLVTLALEAFDSADPGHGPEERGWFEAAIRERLAQVDLLTGIDSLRAQLAALREAAALYRDAAQAAIAQLRRDSTLPWLKTEEERLRALRAALVDTEAAAREYKACIRAAALRECEGRETAAEMLRAMAVEVERRDD